MQLWETSGDPVIDGAQAVVDIDGQPGSPLVHAGRDARTAYPIYLSLFHVTEAVSAASGHLPDHYREQIARSIGSPTPYEFAEFQARVSELEEELAAAKQDVGGIAEVIAENVVDFLKAKERLRPEPSAA